MSYPFFVRRFLYVGAPVGFISAITTGTIRHFTRKNFRYFSKTPLTEDQGMDENKDSLAPGMRVNKYGHVEPVELGLQDWNKRWERNTIGFHRASVSQILVKHVDTLLGGRENLKIFVPLCGKSLDMKWLADMGHTVVGIDCVEIALKEFFEEQNLDYTTEPVEEIDGTLYKSTDGKIRLYMADLFKFTKNLEGQFPAIFDKNSLVAVNKGDRERYCEVMTSLMSQDCRYFLHVVNYDSERYLGPPHDVTNEDVHKLYDSKCAVEEIETADALTDTNRAWGLGLDWFTETVSLLRPK